MASLQYAALNVAFLVLRILASTLLFFWLCARSSWTGLFFHKYMKAHHEPKISSYCYYSGGEFKDQQKIMLHICVIKNMTSKLK